MVFVRINHIPCLTEKTEHKLQKICWHGEPQHRKNGNRERLQNMKKEVKITKNRCWPTLALKGTFKF